MKTVLVPALNVPLLIQELLPPLVAIPPHILSNPSLPFKVAPGSISMDFANAPDVGMVGHRLYWE